MAKAPNLLNDDGSSSVATALMMSHHGFRRDLALFTLALGRLAREGDTTRAAGLAREWQNYRNTLHGHHGAEDQGIFPNVLKESPGLGHVIEGLIADHHRIDPLLEEGDRAFAGLPASADGAADVVARLSALLDPHLAKEEEQIIPVLRNWKAFPPPANEAEATMYADGFAWSSRGVASEVLDRVDATLPEVVTSKLAAARAAFAQRAEQVWGPTQPGASRTAIPDWLQRG
jgi:hemerythrin-like domain-containing protein